MRKMIYFVLILAFTSCNQDDTSKITMKDGKQIELASDKTDYYGDEEEFYESIFLYFPCDYSFLSKNVGPYIVDEDYSLIGYDECFIGAWGKAKFGEWIKKYGLEPNELYYCANIKYVQFMPVLDNLDYVPILPLNDMGYTQWTKNRSFDVEYMAKYPKQILYTGYKLIGYDSQKNRKYKELPLTNNIIWNFTVKK